MHTNQLSSHFLIENITSVSQMHSWGQFASKTLLTTGLISLELPEAKVLDHNAAPARIRPSTPLSLVWHITQHSGRGTGTLVRTAGGSKPRVAPDLSCVLWREAPWFGKTEMRSVIGFASLLNLKFLSWKTRLRLEPRFPAAGIRTTSQGWIFLFFIRVAHA